MRLLQRMKREPNKVRRIRILEQAIRERMRGAEPDRIASKAAGLIANSHGKNSVREVAQAVGIGERRLQQLFYEQVGLPPRTYSRVARLNALLQTLRGMHSVEWAKLASDFGYYDQSHLTNDVHTLTGLTPTAYLGHTVAGSSKTNRGSFGKQSI